MTRLVREVTPERVAAGGIWGVRDLRNRPPVATGSGGGGSLAMYEIKVFEDDATVVVGDQAFEWEIPEDLNGATLVGVETFVTTVSSSGPVTCQLRKRGGGDLLSTPVSIDVGELNSRDASVPAVVIPATILAAGDHLIVDVDAAGVGAQGLGFVVKLTPNPLASVAIAGAKGDPGGIVNWTGAWNGGTAYVKNDAVSNNGTSYVAIAPNTGVQPGVTPGWQTSWQVLAGGQQVTAIEQHISGNGYPISVGLKRYFRVPFACTIVEATLLADKAGSVILDILKGDYGTFPTLASITSASPPTLSGAQKTTDTVLSGWTTAIVAGDVLAFNVNSAALITVLTCALKVTRT